MLISHDLKFDVARSLDVLLDIAIRYAERVSGFGLCSLQRYHEILPITDNAHTAAASSGNGLDDDGKSDFVGSSQGFLFTMDGSTTSRQQSQAQLSHLLPGTRLVSHHPDALCGRPDELNLACLAD